MDPTTKGVLIGVGSAALAVVLAALGNVIRFGYSPAYGPGPATKSVFDVNIVNWFRVLYYFVPYGLFLFGIIYDGLIQKIKFFPAGFVGLFAVYINSWLSYLASGYNAVIDKDICGVPGMSSWGSSLAPNNIVFTTTVLSYIATYITQSQPDSSFTTASWTGVFAMFLLQFVVFFRSGCNSINAPSNGWMFRLDPFGISTPVYGLMIGLLIGGLSGFGFSNLGGDSVGIGLSSEAKQALTSGKSPVTAPVSSGGGKCSATDSDDQFVCEAYKNGELVTSTIVE
jgi:hypothetical protein